jgi:hypothetical protein
MQSREIKEHDQSDEVEKNIIAFACAFTLIAFNMLLMGFVAFFFSQGPYSSDVQEYSYRYMSIGFVFVGAILPAILLKLYGSRSAFVNLAIIAWGLVTLLAFFIYLFLSRGGV